MYADSWLERWLPNVDAHSACRPILELGCGTCDDTGTLEHRGFRVIAADLDAQRLAICARELEQAFLLRLDLRAPLPFADSSFPVVVASLCLHYFAWSDTIQVIQEIRRCQVDGGLLLCRVNSTIDINFGAVGYPTIDSRREGTFYQVNSQTKRFFDEHSVRTLFAHCWAFESLQEQTITRSGRLKAIWEAALRKIPGS